MVLLQIFSLDRQIQAIAVLDPQREMVVDVFPEEDAHAQERSLLPSVLETVTAGQVWIADRNFCTKDFLTGMSTRDASFVIREHLGLNMWLKKSSQLLEGWRLPLKLRIGNLLH